MTKQQPITVEKFASQLKQRVSEMGRVRGNYMLANDFDSACADALRQSDPDAIEPQMLYFQGSRDQYRIVQSRAEEERALAEGWTREARPACEEGYPKIFCEKPNGHPKYGNWHLPRVTILNRNEEDEFHHATEEEDWIPDEQNLYGATGVSLGDLISERKEQMKKILDESPLAPKE